MPTPPPSGVRSKPDTRVPWLDALRGFVMFLMIFVNDLAGAGRVVPDAMVHFSDRHRGGSGMTFVDLVFPAFLFLVGLSIPLAWSGRLAAGQSTVRLLGHALGRTLTLLAIGILMVHETPDTARMGWSGNLWCVLMYLSAMAACCSLTSGGEASEATEKRRRMFGTVVRGLGFAGLLGLALAFRDAEGRRILTLSPLSLSTQWYGILGLIGWAYLVASVVFLVFRHQRTALLGSMALLLCLFAAERARMFEGFWLQRVVGIGGTLGALPSITVAGLLLASGLGLGNPEVASENRVRFGMAFAAGCSAAALLLEPVYGISKNQATPSWCLWSCVVTAVAAGLFQALSSVRVASVVLRPLTTSGRNVFLAYLLSEMLPSLLHLAGLAGVYGQWASTLEGAITRSVLCAAAVLGVAIGLNRLGFRLRL